MHLLQAGVDMATIALWLGHESIDTTHMYLQADLAMKEKALEKLEPIEGEWNVSTPMIRCWPFWPPSDHAEEYLMKTAPPIRSPPGLGMIRDSA